MDTVYYYWHPDEIPAKTPEEDRGGFESGFDLTVIGAAEKKATGRYPDPDELARRIKPRYKADIDYWLDLLERGRPVETNGNGNG